MSETVLTRAYTGKKTDPASVAAWWTERLAGDFGKGGLTPPTVLVVEAREEFDNEYDAEEFLKRELLGNPPGTVLAVAYTAVSQVPTTGETRAYSALKRATDRIAAIREKGLAGLTGAKSVRVGCKRCTSQIARDRLTDVDCPVCGSSLLPAGTQARMTDQYGLAGDAANAILAERPKGKLKRGTYLMVAARLPAGFLVDDDAPLAVATARAKAAEDGADTEYAGGGGDDAQPADADDADEREAARGRTA